MNDSGHRDQTPSKRDRLIRAIDTADRLKEEGVATARDNIAKLSEMSDALQQKLTRVADPGRPALEA